MKYVGLTLEHAARGNMILGCTSIVGVVATSAAHYLKYNKLGLHAITCIIIGSVMMSLTALHTEVILLFLEVNKYF